MSLPVIDGEWFSLQREDNAGDGEAHRDDPLQTATSKSVNSRAKKKKISSFVSQLDVI